MSRITADQIVQAAREAVEDPNYNQNRWAPAADCKTDCCVLGRARLIQVISQAIISESGDLDLRGANLTRADLTDAYLRKADLSGADLSEADLTDAYLRKADLTWANLRGVDLRGADLRGADLYGAKLDGAKLDGAYIDEAYLTELLSNDR